MAVAVAVEGLPQHVPAHVVRDLVLPLHHHRRRQRLKRQAGAVAPDDVRREAASGVGSQEEVRGGGPLRWEMPLFEEKEAQGEEDDKGGGGGAGGPVHVEEVRAKAHQRIAIPTVSDTTTTIYSMYAIVLIMGSR